MRPSLPAKQFEQRRFGRSLAFPENGDLQPREAAAQRARQLPGARNPALAGHGEGVPPEAHQALVANEWM